MKTYTVPGEEGRVISVPEIVAITKDTVFRITEGEFEGVWFTLSDMHMDDSDDCLMHYNVECAGATVDEIKPMVDNFILSILIEQIERSNNGTRSSDPSSNRDS